MTSAEIKEYFVQLIPEETKGKIQPIHWAMIDEFVEHCIDGTATIDGRPPQTLLECAYLIGDMLGNTIPTFDSFITSIRAKFPNEEVDINVNYRAQSFKIHPKK